MSFASGWALAGLLLLVPLVALHLRDRGHAEREVPSLLVWRELDFPPRLGEHGRRLPRVPLALLLQALVVTLLVLALGEPRIGGGTLSRGRVVVIDDSLRMSAPGQLATARRAALRFIDAAPAGAPIAIVAAGATPTTVYRGKAAGAPAALAALRPGVAPDDLGSGLAVASGEAGSIDGRIEVIRARGDAMPQIRGARGRLRIVTVGPTIADQGIFDASARCGIGTPDNCEVYATVVNDSDRHVADAYTAQPADEAPLTGRVSLAAGASAQVALLAGPGERLTLSLSAHDALPSDDSADVTVPPVGGVAHGTTVTLVGTRSRSLALAQALVAVPGIRVRLATPATYRAKAVRRSALVVLDGWMPSGGLPPSPATLLIDPAHLPGGHVGGALTDSVVSGTDQTSPLLDGVDLGSLAISPGAGRVVSPPAWLTPVAWSPSGPLLAAGDNGRRRLAVMSFEPGRSNLPQLSSFPVLVANLVAWASRWAPSSGVVGTPVAADATPGARTATVALGGRVLERRRMHGEPLSFVPARSGFYTVSERGPGVRRTTVVAVGSELPAGQGTVDLSALTARPARASFISLMPWFLLAGLAALTAEALHRSLRRGRVLV